MTTQEVREGRPNENQSRVLWVSCHCGLSDQRFQISTCLIQPMDGTCTTNSKPPLLYIDVAVSLILSPMFIQGIRPVIPLLQPPLDNPYSSSSALLLFLRNRRGLVKGSDKKWCEYSLRVSAGLHVRQGLRLEVLKEKEFACLVHRTQRLYSQKNADSVTRS